MRLRNIISALAMCALAFMTTGCMQKVEPGDVGIIVSTVGSDKGVQMHPAKSGWQLVGMTENLYTFKTWDQNINLEPISFGDQDGARIEARVGVTLNADTDAAPKLFLKYRSDLDGIAKVNVVQVLKTAFTNEASKLKVDAIYGEDQEEFIKRVEVRVREHFKPFGLNVTNLYLLEQFGLPDSIKESLDRKVQANQITAQKQNEVAQAIAEADKLREKAKGDKDAEIARAEGQAAAIALIGEAMRANPQYLELKKIEAWNGAPPQTLVTNGSAPTFLPLK